MPCYARACRQVAPCVDASRCEHVWHACQTPGTSTVWKWTCGDCRATWTLHAADNTWYRDAEG